MKSLVLLLSIIGLGCALSPKFDYEFHYSARLGTGLPNTRSQVAGTAIEFDVLVSMKTASEAFVKFRNIQVGEYHGDVDCDMRGKMPVQFHPLPDKFKHLEDVFHVNFLETKNKVMEVMEDEDMWMTNIRKSVVNHLRIAPLRPTMGEVEGDLSYRMIVSEEDPEMPRSFTIEEDTILGRCPSQYTILRLPEHMENKEYAQEYSQHLTQDDEFGAEQKEHLWRVIRSIDFDNCQDTVFLQQSGVGNATNTGRGKLEYLQSRTSVSQYILRGDQHHLRFERGINEGSYVMNTYGYISQGEEIQLITNQTMHLKSVKSGNTLSASGFKKQVNTWKYEVISPYHREGHAYNWVNFLNKGEEMPMNIESVVTGIKMTPAMINKYKEEFMKTFESAVEEAMKEPQIEFKTENGPLNSNSGRSAVLFYYSTSLINGLKYKQINELFDHFSKQSGEKGDLMKMFIVDVIAASGTRDAAKVLLERMKSKEITATRAATVFMTYTNNIVEPELFHDVMEFIKTLDLKEHPYFGAAAYINFAKMVNRQCINEHTKNFTIPTPILGDHVCTRFDVHQVLLRLLREKIDLSQTSWERAIYAQALSNLGSTEVIDILRPYIYGERDMNPRVRITAMYALASWKLAPINRFEVFDILMKIVDNLGENPEVRQRAIKVMLTWQPDSSWWNRLAALTWHEPSRQMQSFISSTIHNAALHNSIATGRQTHIAKQALHLARPSTPSLRYSYNFHFSKFNRPSELLNAGELSMLTNSESVIPKDLDLFFYMRLGGFDYKLFDIDVQNDGLQEPMYRFFDKLRNMLQPTGTENVRNSNAAKAADIYTKYLDAVQMESYHRHEPEAMIFTKVFDNMEHYFQLNADVFEKYLAGDKSIIGELIVGKPIHLTKFFNPVPVTTAIASEVGLPVLSMTVAPTINLLEGEVKLSVEGKTNPTFYELVTAEKIDLDFKFQHKFITKASTKMEAIVPWAEKKVLAGIDSERTFNLPIKGHLEYNRKNVDKYLKLTVTPTLSKKFPLISGRNVPFTAVKDMMFSHDKLNTMDFKPMYIDLANKKPLNHVTRKFAKELTGIDLEMEWEGDIDYPFVSGDIYELLRKPERILTTLGGVDARQWRFAVFMDPTSSTTKTVELKTSIIPNGNKAGEPLDQPLSVTDTNVQRYQKTRSFLNAKSTDHFGAARVELQLTGSENRKYDAGISWYREPMVPIEHSQLFVYGLRTDLPGYSPAPASVCLNLEARSLDLSNYFIDPEDLLKKNPSISLYANLNSGKTNCMEKTDVTVDMKLTLSTERRQELEYELSHTSCTMDKHNNTCNGLPIDAVYDRADVKITFDKTMPKYLLNATYIVDDVVRGFMFPQIYFNHMDVQNDEGKIRIHGERPLESHYWKFWTEMPHRRSIIEKVHVPMILDEVMQIGGTFTPVKRFNQIFLGEPVEKTKCLINSARVHTYDGYDINTPALPCWTVATKDRAEENSWVLETRFHNGEMEARLTSVNTGLIIFAKEGFVQVNGEQITLKNGEHKNIMLPREEIFAIIHNIEDKYYVEMPNKLHVFMKDHNIEIMAGLRYKGMGAGLCGTYDGERMFDLQGPKHCLYDDQHHELFYKSYVSEETDCPNFAAWKDEVKQFQAQCTKAFTHDYQPAITHNYFSQKNYCKMTIYQLLEADDEICQEVSPSTQCHGGCKETLAGEHMVNAKCWKKTHAPTEIKSNFPTPGFIEVPVKEQGDHFRSFLVRYSKQCISK